MNTHVHPIFTDVIENFAQRKPSNIRDALRILVSGLQARHDGVMVEITEVKRATGVVAYQAMVKGDEVASYSSPDFRDVLHFVIQKLDARVRLACAPIRPDDLPGMKPYRSYVTCPFRCGEITLQFPPNNDCAHLIGERADLAYFVEGELMPNRYNTNHKESDVPKEYLRLFTDPCGCRVDRVREGKFALRTCANHRKGMVA